MLHKRKEKKITNSHRDETIRYGFSCLDLRKFKDRFVKKYTLKSLILSVKLIRFKILYEFNSRDANINIFQCLALAKKQMQSIGVYFHRKIRLEKGDMFS